jgi:hypothetical protein
LGRIFRYPIVRPTVAALPFTAVAFTATLAVAAVLSAPVDRRTVAFLATAVLTTAVLTTAVAYPTGTAAQRAGCAFIAGVASLAIAVHAAAHFPVVRVI